MARELLEKALAAHGGLARWSCFATVQATIVTGGQLFGLKGTPQDPTPRLMTVATQREWASVFPYGADDQRTDFTANRIAVEKLDVKAGHNSLKPPITPRVYILQNAAASGVGRLLTQVSLDRGVRPIRLVRSNESPERLRSALPGPPVYSTSDSNWKQQVREALGGHKLSVAFDALGGKAIDDLAELVGDGGTIINFGSLQSNMGTNIYSLVPNNLSLKSVSIMNWFRLAE